MPRLTTIRLGGSPAPWVQLGLAIGTDSATIGIGGVRCRFDFESTTALIALGFDALASPVDADGLSFFPEIAGPTSPSTDHACQASAIDHVVVMTSSLERTCGAVADALDAPLKRVREAGPGVRQGFHRLGEVILEIVETPQITAPHAEYWGLVVVVEDLEGWTSSMGPELVSTPKPAVQPGRRISNVRREAGLGIPVAFMSPDRRPR